MEAPKFTLETQTQVAAASAQDENKTQVRGQQAAVETPPSSTPMGDSIGMGGDEWSLIDVQPISSDPLQQVEMSAVVAPSGVTDALHLDRGVNPKFYILGGIGLVMVVLLALILFTEEGADVAEVVEVPKPVATDKVLPDAVQEILQVAAATETSPANPYWSLPNLKPAAQPPERAWSTQDEEIYRAGMNHRFTYQHYKTVTEVRAKRLGGSETILTEALGEPKFWTRMQAAFGLVEMGVELDLAMMQRVIGDATGSQIHNYLKRFRSKATESELYVLRQMIRFADERTRLLILQTLRSRNDKMAGLYLVAGTFDPGKKVNEWVQSALQEQAIAATDVEHYRRVVMGTEKYVEKLVAVAPKRVDPALPEAKATEYRIERAEAEALGSEAPTAAADDVQDIEFFDEVKDEQELQENPDDGFEDLKAKAVKEAGEAI